MTICRFVIATLISLTAPDEKFIPPNLDHAGRFGCYVEGTDPAHQYADAKVFSQTVDPKLDYRPVIARRDDLEKLSLDCSAWFRDMAEEFHKQKEKHKQ